MRAFLFAFVFLAGCASSKYWYKEGSSGPQFERDRSECNAKAFQAIPPYQPPQPTQYTPPPRYEGGFSAAVNAAQGRDTVDQGRNAMVENCLYQKGYSPRARQ